MTETADQKLADFLEEARAITRNHDFGGAPNKAMFWGHTEKLYPKFRHARNGAFCKLYVELEEQDCYLLNHRGTVAPIMDFFRVILIFQMIIKI